MKSRLMASKGLFRALVLVLLLSAASVYSVQVQSEVSSNLMKRVDRVVNTLHTQTNIVTKKTTVIKTKKTCKPVNRCKLAQETARNFARSVAMIVLSQGLPEEAGYEYVTKMLEKYKKANRLDAQCFVQTFKRLYPKSYKIFGLDHYESVCKKTKCSKVELQEVSALLATAQEKHRYLIAEYEASELEPSNQEKDDLEQDLTRLEDVMQRLTIRLRACSHSRRIDFVNKRKMLDYDDPDFGHKRKPLDDDEFWKSRHTDVSIIEIRKPRKNHSLEYELERELELVNLRSTLDDDPDNPFRDIDRISVNHTLYYVREKFIHRKNTERFDLKERFTTTEKEIARLRILRTKYVKDPTYYKLVIVIDKEIKFLTEKLHVIVEQVDAMNWVNTQLREIEREAQRTQLLHPNNHTVIIQVYDRKENVTRLKEDKKLEIERMLYIDEIVHVEDLIEELEKEKNRLQNDTSIPLRQKVDKQDRIRVKIIELEDQKRVVLENFLDKIDRYNVRRRIRNHKELIRREILYSRLERDVERVKRLHDALNRLNEEIIKKWREIDAEYEKIKQLRDEETQKIHTIIIKFSNNPTKKNRLEKFPKGQNETLETADEQDEYPEDEKAQDEIDGVRKEYAQRTRTIRDRIRVIRNNYESKIDEIGRESTKDRLCNPETINSLVTKRKVLEDETQNILHNIKSLNEYQHGVEIKDLRTKLETINNQQYRVINFQVVCTVHPVPVLDRNPPPIPGRGDPSRKPRRPERPNQQPKLPPSFTNNRGQVTPPPPVILKRPGQPRDPKTPKDNTKPAPRPTDPSTRPKRPSAPKDPRSPTNPTDPNKRPPRGPKDPKQPKDPKSPKDPKKPPTTTPTKPNPTRRPTTQRKPLPDDPLHVLYNKTRTNLDDRLKKLIDSPNKRIFDRIRPLSPKDHCVPVFDETLTRIEQNLRLQRAIVSELRKQLTPEDRRLIQQQFSLAMKRIQEELTLVAEYHKKCKEFRAGSGGKTPREPKTPILPGNPTNGTNHTAGNHTSPTNTTKPVEQEPDYTKYRRPGDRRPRDGRNIAKTNGRGKLDGSREPEKKDDEEIVLTKREERRYRSRSPGQPISLKDLLEGKGRFRWTPFPEDEENDKNKTSTTETPEGDKEPVLPEEFWLQNVTLADEELTKVRKVYIRRRKEYVRRLFDFNSRKKDDVLIVLLQNPHLKNQTRPKTLTVLEEKDRLATLKRYFEDRFNELTPRDQKNLERHHEFAKFLLYQKFNAIRRVLKDEPSPKDGSWKKGQNKDRKQPNTNGTQQTPPNNQATREVEELMRKLAYKPTGRLVEELLDELPAPKRCTKQMFDLLLATSRDIQNQNTTLVADFGRLPAPDKEDLKEEFELVEHLVEKKLGDIEEYLHTCSRKENQPSNKKDSEEEEPGVPTDEESEEYLTNYIRKFQLVSRLINELASKQLPRDLERFLGENTDFSNDKKATRVRDVQRELHHQLFVTEDEWSDFDEADRKPLEPKYRTAVQHAEALLKRLRDYLLKAKQPPVESDEIEPVGLPEDAEEDKQVHETHQRSVKNLKSLLESVVKQKHPSIQEERDELLFPRIVTQDKLEVLKIVKYELLKLQRVYTTKFESLDKEDQEELRPLFDVAEESVQVLLEEIEEYLKQAPAFVPRRNNLTTEESNKLGKTYHKELESFGELLQHLKYRRTRRIDLLLSELPNPKNVTQNTSREVYFERHILKHAQARLVETFNSLLDEDKEQFVEEYRRLGSVLETTISKLDWYLEKAVLTPEENLKLEKEEIPDDLENILAHPELKRPQGTKKQTEQSSDPKKLAGTKEAREFLDELTRIEVLLRERKSVNKSVSDLDDLLKDVLKPRHNDSSTLTGLENEDKDLSRLVDELNKRLDRQDTDHRPALARKVGRVVRLVRSQQKLVREYLKRTRTQDAKPTDKKQSHLRSHTPSERQRRRYWYHRLLRRFRDLIERESSPTNTPVDRLLREATEPKDFDKNTGDQLEKEETRLTRVQSELETLHRSLLPRDQKATEKPVSRLFESIRGKLAEITRYQQAFLNQKHPKRPDEDETEEEGASKPKTGVKPQNGKKLERDSYQKRRYDRGVKWLQKHIRTLERLESSRVRQLLNKTADKTINCNTHDSLLVWQAAELLKREDLIVRVKWANLLPQDQQALKEEFAKQLRLVEQQITVMDTYLHRCPASLQDETSDKIPEPVFDDEEHPDNHTNKNGAKNSQNKPRAADDPVIEDYRRKIREFEQLVKEVIQRRVPMIEQYLVDATKHRPLYNKEDSRQVSSELEHLKMLRTIILSQDPFLTPEDKKRTAPVVRDAVSRLDEQINKLLEYLRIYPLNRRDRSRPAEPDFLKKLPKDGDEDLEKEKIKPKSGLSLPWSKQAKSPEDRSPDPPIARQYRRTLRKFLRYLEEPERIRKRDQKNDPLDQIIEDSKKVPRPAPSVEKSLQIKTEEHRLEHIKRTLEALYELLTPEDVNQYKRRYRSAIDDLEKRLDQLRGYLKEHPLDPRVPINPPKELLDDRRASRTRPHVRHPRDAVDIIYRKNLRDFRRIVESLRRRPTPRDARSILREYKYPKSPRPDQRQRTGVLLFEDDFLRVNRHSVQARYYLLDRFDQLRLYPRYRSLVRKLDREIVRIERYLRRYPPHPDDQLKPSEPTDPSDPHVSGLNPANPSKKHENDPQTGRRPDGKDRKPKDPLRELLNDIRDKVDKRIRNLNSRRNPKVDEPLKELPRPKSCNKMVHQNLLDEQKYLKVQRTVLRAQWSDLDHEHRIEQQAEYEKAWTALSQRLSAIEMFLFKCFRPTIPIHPDNKPHRPTDIDPRKHLPTNGTTAANNSSLPEPTPAINCVGGDPFLTKCSEGFIADLKSQLKHLMIDNVRLVSSMNLAKSGDQKQKFAVYKQEYSSVISRIQNIKSELRDCGMTSLVDHRICLKPPVVLHPVSSIEMPPKTPIGTASQSEQPTNTPLPAPYSPGLLDMDTPDPAGHASPAAVETPAPKPTPQPGRPPAAAPKTTGTRRKALELGRLASEEESDSDSLLQI